MRTVRVYVDTSVFGGTQDAEFARYSKRFFDGVIAGGFVVLVSEQTLAEMELAPAEVRRVLEGLPAQGVERVSVDEEVEALADAYIQAGVLGVGSRGDAIHVAAAAVAGADLILSWNFRHVVRYDRIRMFNGVNAIRGYDSLDIRSPMEVAYDSEEEDV